MVRNRSWPAVSHCAQVSRRLSLPSVAWRLARVCGRGGLRRTICSFTVLPSSSIVRIFCGGQLSARPMGGLVAETYEVDADGGDVGLCVGVVGETQQQARLADTGVTDEQQLEEVVVSSILSAAATGRRAGVRVGGRRRRRRNGGWVAGRRRWRGPKCQQQTKTEAGGGRGNALLGIHLGRCGA